MSATQEKERNFEIAALTGVHWPKNQRNEPEKDEDGNVLSLAGGIFEFDILNLQGK